MVVFGSVWLCRTVVGGIGVGLRSVCAPRVTCHVSSEGMSIDGKQLRWVRVSAAKLARVECSSVCKVRVEKVEHQCDQCDQWDRVTIINLRSR
jgi:hypothetical protein